MDRKGFALLELIVVVAVIAALAGSGWYFTRLQNQSSAINVGTDAEQQARQAVQQANQQIKQEQNILKQTEENSVTNNITQAEGCTLLPYTGTTPLNQLQYYSPGQEDLRGGMVCESMINPNLPIFNFHFTGQADNTLGDITITKGSSNKIIQTITNTTSYDATLTPATDTLVLVDANFDGYKDLKILNNCGATGNCSYDFYLYDPISNQFVHSNFLSNLGTPSIDEAKKEITTSWNSSADDWEEDTYQYQADGQYIIVKKIISTSNDATIRTYELRSGKMELINSTTTASQ